MELCKENNTMELSEVLNISKELGQNDLTKSLEEISVRNQMQNAQLVLPLVGEFSSGKTTLINDLYITPYIK